MNDSTVANAYSLIPHFKRPLKKARREIIQDLLSKNPDQNKNNQVWSRKKETEKRISTKMPDL